MMQIIKYKYIINQQYKPNMKNLKNNKLNMDYRQPYQK